MLFPGLSIENQKLLIRAGQSANFEEGSSSVPSNIHSNAKILATRVHSPPAPRDRRNFHHLYASAHLGKKLFQIAAHCSSLSKTVHAVGTRLSLGISTLIDFQVENNNAIADCTFHRNVSFRKLLDGNKRSGNIRCSTSELLARRL